MADAGAMQPGAALIALNPQAFVVLRAIHGAADRADAVDVLLLRLCLGLALLPPSARSKKIESTLNQSSAD